MLETELRISNLIAASLQGNITNTEQVQLDAWLLQDPVNQEHFETAYQDHVLKENLRIYNSADRESIWRKTTAKISTNESKAKEVPVRKLYRFRQITIAATVTLMILGVYFFNYRGRINLNRKNLVVNDIAPGSIGATLTLDNGRQIKLSDVVNGEIAKEAGIIISKTADGRVVYEVRANETNPNKVNTLTTSKGETYILTLPDHSKVWLNAASSLTYRVALLQDGARRVKLVGEAYFEVAKDKAHPFIVESGKQKVEVLGTQFNVNAYSDEAVIRTTLLEGSVKLSEDGNSKILIPGNQAVNNVGNIKVHEVNTSLVTAWKNNNFIFDRLSIQEIMRIISRWYDVEIIYEGTPPSDTFWGSVSRFENVSEVLNALEKTGNVHFKIQGRRIYVSR